MKYTFIFIINIYFNIALIVIMELLILIDNFIYIFFSHFSKNKVTKIYVYIFDYSLVEETMKMRNPKHICILKIRELFLC